MNNDPRSLTRRPSRGLPAAVLAVALMAVGALGAWLSTTRLFTGRWPDGAASTMTALASTRLDSPLVVIAIVVLAVLGLVALLLALWPGKPQHLTILPDDVPGQTVLSRRDLAALVRLRVEQVDGVDTVRVRVTGRRVDVLVSTVVPETEPVRRAALDAADGALERLDLERGLRTRARVRRAN